MRSLRRVDPARPDRSRRRLVAAGAAWVLAATGAVGLSVGLAPTASAGEFLSNGGFESGTLSPWTCTGGTGSVVTGHAHSGTYALAGAASSSDDAQCSQTVTVTPNTTYTLSAFVNGAYVYLGVTGAPAPGRPARAARTSSSRSASPPPRARPAPPSTRTAGTGRAPTTRTTSR